MFVDWFTDVLRKSLWSIWRVRWNSWYCRYSREQNKVPAQGVDSLVGGSGGVQTCWNSFPALDYVIALSRFQKWRLRMLGEISREITCFSGISTGPTEVALEKMSWQLSLLVALPRGLAESPEPVHLTLLCNSFGMGEEPQDVLLQMQPLGCLFLNSGSTRDKE